MMKTLIYLCLVLFSQLALAAGDKAFNPDISVNFLGYVRESNLNLGNGFVLQEAEMQFYADVDPYFRANALFSISQKPGTTDFSIDPEEVFVESIFLPVVTIKAGKFKAALGKHNTLHTHAFPFIDAPLISTDLLGDEGLNEVGVSAATLIPINWYMEITTQLLSSTNDVLYDSPNRGNVSVVAQIKNLWDLSDDATLEWSLYGTEGKNKFLRTAQVLGTDLIFKWRPSIGGKYHALIFANQYLDGNSPGNGFTVGQGNALRLGGLASWLQYQFAERWWVQGRMEFEGLPRSETFSDRRKQSALLGFYPSEFSGFRLQYDHMNGGDQPAGHAITLQWNITIGAHPAHSY
jgi:hypothetical protein